MPELMVILKKFFAYNDKKWELSVGTYSAKGYSMVETIGEGSTGFPHSGIQVSPEDLLPPMRLKPPGTHLARCGSGSTPDFATGYSMTWDHQGRVRLGFPHQGNPAGRTRKEVSFKDALKD